MSNVMQRIANYFQNDYEGIDKTSPAFEVTVEELREIAGINTERCRLLAMERATYKPALQKLESIKQELINCENENEESGYCGDFEDFQLFHDKVEQIINDY